MGVRGREEENELPALQSGGGRGGSILEKTTGIDSKEGFFM